MHCNILFHGSSFTWGGELEGKDNDFEFQKTHRFSHLVADHFKMSYENISSQGGSNDSIVRETIEWFEAGNTCDLAVIQFTHLERLEYICGIRNIPIIISPSILNISKLHWKNNINLRNKYEFTVDLINRYYEDVYNDNDALYRFYKNLFILEKTFIKYNVRYLFLRVVSDKNKIDNDQILWKNLCNHSYNKIPHIIGGILDKNFNNKKEYCEHNGLDTPFGSGMHPNAFGHQKIANHLIERINNAHFV